ncbi:Protocatechuate 3,4-dioxygenase beta chain [Tsuneonella dongtanensis]|uniref:Protocatechuate 3,4-dioxygenase beta chain n=1 Tax=Tsuneonella dongtanensis TaxID=692370 RepID=A0A1B2AGI0_9SPHN|nr:protocatechuate 3,4-dioxygenase [Tsuneonella dongtanensis]ANY21252.1 Protocatechuate 3,4-dioxygenase beta chain [Tsuneonella dongtanensis]
MVDRLISRRTFAVGTVAGAVMGTRALAQTMTATSDMGPFFPVSYRGETDADLTRVDGGSGRAKGQVIEVMGRVLDRFGKPIPGAKLDIWQANAAGRYAHPQDPAIMPLDPNFQGFASIHTGTDGSWKMLTVKPGSYASPIGERPPHIHMDVVGRDYRGVYQMYFPEDEEANKRDSLYKTLGDGAPSSIARGLGDHRYGWDIVLFEG